MKKVLAIILTLVMVFSLCACGTKEPAEEQSQANVKSSDTVEEETTSSEAEEQEPVSSEATEETTSSETEETPEVVEPIVADEEIVGMWVDGKGTTFEFTEDNALKWADTVLFADPEYYPWIIEGNVLSFESYGDQYKWEIQIENEEITLKFIDEGLDYALPMACVDLVKQP